MTRARKEKRYLHALNEDGMVLCNPRDREAAHRADMEGIATDNRAAVTCRKCKELLYSAERERAANSAPSRDVIVKLDPVANLTEAEREAILDLTLAVYPPESIAYWPGRTIEWAAPVWGVRVIGEDARLLSYVGVYLRNAEYNGGPVLIGGIGNVKTHPAARRRGLAELAIRHAVEFLTSQGADFGVLVCEPKLIPYYSRLGWGEFTGRLVVRQGEDATDFLFNRVMVLSLAAGRPSSACIDLCGPPW